MVSAILTGSVFIPDTAGHLIADDYLPVSRSHPVIPPDRLHYPSLGASNMAGIPFFSPLFLPS